MTVVGGDSQDSVVDLAIEQLYNAVGYGSPAEGMAATIILIILSIIATFISLGATLFLVFIFVTLFFMHLVRAIWPWFDGWFPGGR